MANISLRSYQQEIERLIDSGRTEEALVHCHHILQKFPRSVDTYRLLGKTFLESQRYGDAADIFQRVLSAIPDDFVSHVGMSIIREDEGNLDEAIWHMERAFEIQPSNSAIQEELRRLFERRDDIEPPKIRLTRSALARMYAKGGLYDQAIAEARAILAADANRLDILVLLARVQANADNQVDAAESASNVLQKLPYCLEANRVMAEVLAESDRLEEAQPYRQRAISLVPYDAYINEDFPTSEDVPEQTIMVEKIVYKPGEVPDIESGQPSWATSLGVRISELGSGMDEIPDWLAITSEEKTEELEKPPEPTVAATAVESPGEDVIAETPTTEEDDIPAWMKEAGWEPSSGIVEESEFQLSIEDESALTEEETDIAKAEIPAWLQAMAPADKEILTTGEELEALGELDLDSELPDWLNEESAAPLEIPDWLSSIESETPTIIAEQVEEISIPVDQEPVLPSEEEIPDWLQEFVPESKKLDQEPLPSEEMPEWLMEVEGAKEVLGITHEEGRSADEAPDWLGEVEEEAPEEIPEELLEAEAGEKEIPEWLTAGAIAATAVAAAELLDHEEEPAEPTEAEELPVEELPEWLEEIKGAEEALEVEAEALELEEEAVAVSAEELPEWLMEIEGAEEVLEVEPGALELEELAEAVPTEEIPEWLDEFEGAEEAPEVEAEALELEEVVGAQPAEELPEWLMEMEGVEEALEVVAEVPELEEEVEAQPAEELPEWLEEIAGAEEALEVEAEALELEEEAVAVSAEELPEWLMEIEGAEEALEVEHGLELEEVAEAVPTEEVPEWLDEFEGAEEALEVEAEALELEEKVEAQPAEELPEWLAELEGVEETPEEEAEALELEEKVEAQPAEELPEWLEEFEPVEEVPEEEAEALELEEEAEPAEGIPAWLAAGAVAASTVVAAEILDQEGESAEPIEAETPSAEELPEWLEEFEGVEEAPETIVEALELEEEAEPAEEIPEWLAAGAMDATEVTAAEILDHEEEPAETEAEALPAEELPEWLEEIAGAEEALEVEAEALELKEEAVALPAEELPEWLMEIEGAEEALEGEAEALELEEEVEAQPSEELSEWLAEFERIEEAPEEEAKALEFEEEAEPAEEIPEWLAAGAVAASAVAAAEILAHEEEPAEPTEAEAQPAEELPEWTEEFEVAEAAPEVEAELISPVEEIEAVSAEELPESLEEIEAVAEAPEAEVEALEPEEEAELAEEFPDWLMEIEGAEEALKVEGREEVEAAPMEEAPEWLEEIELVEEAPEVEVEALEPEEEVELAEELPDWLMEIEGAEEALKVEAREEVEAAPMEEAPEWLEEIEVVEEAPEAEVEALELEGEAEPSEEIPEWLAAGAVIASAITAAEILDKGEEPAEPVKGEVVDEEDIPEFLKKPRDLEVPQVSPLEPETWEAAYDIEEQSEPILGDTQPTRVRIPDESAAPAEAPPLEKPEVEAIPETTLEESDQVEAAEEVIPEVPEAVIEEPIEEETETILEADEGIAAVAPEEISEVEESEGEAVEAIDEELKPVTPAVDDDAAFAWLEALAVKQGVEEALLLTPEERIETPPEWVQEADEAAVVEEREAEMTLEGPVEEVESAEIIPIEELIEEELLEVEVPTEAVEELEEPAKALDDEAAFAWLEALAVKQGADEALLLTPEERLETPPEWVQEAEEETELEVVEGEEEPGLEEALATISAAQAALEEVVELEEAALPPETITEGLAEEMPAVEVSEGISEETLAEAAVEESAEPTAELEKPAIEAPEMVEEVTEAVETAEEEHEPEETVPDLPDWLAQEPPTGDVELEWTPPLVRLELNQASLAELERLPGIGFIMAQRIINYREQAGGFNTLDDLLLVPEFDESNLEELKERLYVEYLPTPEPEIRPIKAEPILDETSVIPELTVARGALNENDLSTAIQHYAKLIKSNQLLPEVIEDLSLAIEHYPEEVGIWQSLGDAYLRSNQIQEALEAYIKAEKLLR